METLTLPTPIAPRKRIYIRGGGPKGLGSIEPESGPTKRKYLLIGDPESEYTSDLVPITEATIHELHIDLLNCSEPGPWAPLSVLWLTREEFLNHPRRAQAGYDHPARPDHDEDEGDWADE